MELRSKALYAGLVVLSAALFWFGTGLHPIWLLTWVAPVPVLAATVKLPARPAQWLCFTAYSLGGLNELSYYSHAVPLLMVLAILGPAALFGWFAVRWRRHILSGKVLFANATFAASWVGYEFLSQLISPHSSYASIGYTQADCLPILQLASVTGILGVTFLTMLVSASLASLSLFKLKVAGLKQAVSVSLAAVLLVAVYGLVRLANTPHEPSVLVGMIATDQPESEAEFALGYSNGVRRLVASGAEVVVAPEKIWEIQDVSQPLVNRVFGGTRAEVVAGMDRTTVDGVCRNEARVYTEGTLAPVALYEKHHMLPPFESKYVVGRDYVLRTVRGISYGVAICKDMTFPDFGRTYGNMGAGIMFVPAEDFVEDGWLANRIGIIRGVESGYSVVRCARYGIIGAGDSRGHILAESNTGSKGFASLLVRVPALHEKTLYDVAGDWFSWICLVGTVLSFFTRAREMNPPVGLPA